jgi:hypothetical protein
LVSRCPKQSAVRDDAYVLFYEREGAGSRTRL